MDKTDRRENTKSFQLRFNRHACEEQLKFWKML